MPRPFQPRRLSPLIEPQLDARLRRIEDYLGNLGRAPVNPNQVQMAAPLKSAGIGSFSGGGGGGGGGETILFGDVTGPANNNTVSFLQTNPLSLLGVTGGDLIAYSAVNAAFINTQSVIGAYTMNAKLDSNTALTLGPHSATQMASVFRVINASGTGLFFVQTNPAASSATATVQTPLGATVGPAIFNVLDGAGNIAAQQSFLTSGAQQFSLADSVAANLKVTGSVTPVWQVNTDGSQQGGLSLSGADSVSNAREFMRGIANGSAAAVGFLGATPHAQEANTADLRQTLIDFGFVASGGASPLNLNGGALTAGTSSLGATTLSGDLTLSTHNVITDTVTGTKIGTSGGAAGQKLGFFNATPIVQPLLATGAAHTVDDVITTLQNLGLCRQT